jgi:hypothetical protein
VLGRDFRGEPGTDCRVENSVLEHNIKAFYGTVLGEYGGHRLSRSRQFGATPLGETWLTRTIRIIRKGSISLAMIEPCIYFIEYLD